MAFPRLAAMLVAVLSSTATFAAEPPAKEDPPLPAGALRLGSTQNRLTSGWHKKVYFTADAKNVLVTHEEKVELWDPDTGRPVGTIPLPKSRIHASDFHTKGNLLALFGTIIPAHTAAKWEPKIWLIDAGECTVEMASGILLVGGTCEFAGYNSPKPLPSPYFPA